MSPGMESAIIRPVQVLRGYKNIAAALRTSEDKVRDMISAGASVVMDSDMPKAEAAEMWVWYAGWLGLRKKAAGDREACRAALLGRLGESPPRLRALAC